MENETNQVINEAINYAAYDAAQAAWGAFGCGVAAEVPLAKVAWDLVHQLYADGVLDRPAGLPRGAMPIQFKHDYMRHVRINRGAAR